MLITRRVLLTFGTVLSLICLSIPSAVAQSSSVIKEAEDLGQAGVHLFKARKYKLALVQFLDSYSKYKVPGITWNIGRCYEELGDLPTALPFFEEFLESTKGTSGEDRAKNKVSEVRQKIRATVVFVMNEKNATLQIDGSKVSAEARKGGVRLAPGRHTVRVSKTGFRDHDSVLELEALETRTVMVTLERMVGLIVVSAETGSLDGVKVSIDGKKVFEGTVPARIPINAGEYSISIQVPEGYESIERGIGVADKQRVSFVLKATPEPVVIAEPEPEPTELAVEAPSLGPEPSPVKAGLLWGGLGAAVLGAGFNIWGAVEWNNATDGNHTYDQVKSAQSSASWKYYVAYGLYGAGAVAFVVSFFADDGMHPFGIAATPTQEGAAVSVSGRW